jgi:hypothetical protein
VLTPVNTLPNHPATVPTHTVPTDAPMAAPLAMNLTGGAASLASVPDNSSHQRAMAPIGPDVLSMLDRTNGAAIQEWVLYLFILLVTR